ncbi:MAG: dihydrolipoyl dehydrogenase [Sedimentisphaerales bacterium]|nr:dihydrolipoyl dehydrogenase [Sedimentisphaerales bacterium]
MMAEKFDVVVIGSGTGGYAAAIRCAQRGATVAVIEKGVIGGTCLNYGCIPSKALLACAQTLMLIKLSKMMGVDVTSALPNWPAIQTRKDAIVAGFCKGLTHLLQSHQVKIIQGSATVRSPGKVTAGNDGAKTEFEADKIILATGSKPIEIPTMPFDGQTIISSKEALELDEIPQSLVIIGGGVIGCELACVYAVMGTKVTIIEALSRLIATEDEWVSRLLEREFKKLGIEVLTGQKAASVDKLTSPAKITCQSGQSLGLLTEEIEAEKVLVCIGRKAVCDKDTIDSLDLELRKESQGLAGAAIKVDEKMQTSAPEVYAVGDVVGTTFLAHGAFAEAQVAAVNATGGDEKMGDYCLIPRAVYTFPEIASVGKTEQACKAEGLDISVGKAFFKANGRSAAHNETTGRITVVKNNSTNRIIGVTMVGAMVTELIAAARTLIGSSEKVSEISFPHPTVSEVLKEAAEDAFGLSLHNLPKM